MIGGAKAKALEKLIGDWLVMGFDPNYAPHKAKVQKTVNAIVLEMGITPQMSDDLYVLRRERGVNEVIDILEAFMEVAGTQE